MNPPDWMLTLNIPTSCISRQTAVEENQRRFRVIPREGELHDKIWAVQVDGCWLNGKDGKRVDYLL